MPTERIEEVAGSLISLDYDGIVQFDASEPEYDYLVTATDRFGDLDCVALLSILAGTEDYQLAGDAQLFWRTLTETITQVDEIASEQDVHETISMFMEKPVNARLRDQKKDRLVRMLDNGFGKWFLGGYPDHDPVHVWEEIAAALETTIDKKTVIFAMKVYDIFRLVVNGEYLNLPVDVPIPCDLQVVRVASASGIVDIEEKGKVMDAWADVMRRVNRELDRPVSMLRIDSIVWQAGQIISDNNDRRDPSRRALQGYFAEVGLGVDESQRLAEEFTLALE